MGGLLERLNLGELKEILGGCLTCLMPSKTALCYQNYDPWYHYFIGFLLIGLAASLFMFLLVIIDWLLQWVLKRSLIRYNVFWISTIFFIFIGVVYASVAKETISNQIGEFKSWLFIISIFLTEFLTAELSFLALLRIFKFWLAPYYVWFRLAIQTIL